MKLPSPNLSRGSFSGHGGGYGGGHDQGCTYCAKIVWIGVAALAIQVVLMQQGAGGGGKKRKRRNTIDSEAMERLKEEFIAGEKIMLRNIYLTLNKKFLISKHYLNYKIFIYRHIGKAKNV